MRTWAAVAVSVAGLAASTNLAVAANVFNMPSGQKSLELVTVGDPGNTADTRFGRDYTKYPYDPISYGAVEQTFQMGKYFITVAQYTQFLNAVAQTDTYGLYSPGMATWGLPCGIVQSGSSGSYTYSVAPNRDDYPVNWVSWADAARFCNWLTNGQPSGPQGPGTTERGSYLLNGLMVDTPLMGVARSTDARYVIPNEDEWYKAAYYKGGSTNAGYWTYPTRSDLPPSNVLSSTGTNNANFYDNGFTDPVNKLTPAGAFAGSPGPYGTFDQGGNLWQWTEANLWGTTRVLRAGSCGTDVTYLRPSVRATMSPSGENGSSGFRVALVPEPATLSLLALGGLLLARRRRA